MKARSHHYASPGNGAERTAQYGQAVSCTITTEDEDNIDRPFLQRAMITAAKKSPEKQVSWDIQDQGIAFDPTKPHETLSQPDSIEMRRDGGFGILLMRKFMDEIHYARKEEKNILTLVRYIAP